MLQPRIELGSTAEGQTPHSAGMWPHPRAKAIRGSGTWLARAWATTVTLGLPSGRHPTKGVDVLLLELEVVSPGSTQDLVVHGGGKGCGTAVLCRCSAASNRLLIKYRVHTWRGRDLGRPPASATCPGQPLDLSPFQEITGGSTW